MTNVLGYAYYKLGNNDEALKSFRQVQDICNTVSKQVTVGPKPLWLLNLMALSHSNIGWIHKEKGELQMRSSRSNEHLNTERLWLIRTRLSPRTR